MIEVESNANQFLSHNMASKSINKSINPSLQKNQQQQQNQKRNMTNDIRTMKIDDNKLLEVNRKKVVLFQYLSKINKEKKIIKEKNSAMVDIKQTKTVKRPIKTNEEILKKKETRRGKRLLLAKKQKKEEKKKQKKQKTNFLTANNYMKNLIFEDYDLNNLKEIKNWVGFLKGKMRKFFSPHALNIDFLIKQFEIFFNMNLGRSVDTSKSELSKLRNFKGTEMQSKSDKSQFDNDDEGKIDNIQKIKLAEEQKKLLDALVNKENVFVKSREETLTFLTNMKAYENALKNKNYSMMQNYITPTPSGQPQGGGERDQKSQNEKVDKQSVNNDIDPKEADKLKERVINFTLKTFDQFSLKRIVEYWIDNCDKLQEKKTRDLHYKYQPVDQKEEKNERERKKKQKAINVMHIYSTPTNEVLQIIPFCSKKYTIQKKDG